jgi:hypothetical protein
MSDATTLRVTPAELAGVAAEARTLTHAALVGSSRLRGVVAAVDPPDPAADEFLKASARGTQAALDAASERLASLLSQLGRALERQAIALAAAARGYAYVERQVSAACVAAEVRRE